MRCIYVLMFCLVGCSSKETIEKDQMRSLLNLHSPELGNVQSDSGGWSAPNVPLVTGIESEVSALQVNFPKAGYYTVQFGFKAPTLAGSGGVAQPEAILVWKVEGNTVTRRVSVGNGVSISGVGQAVEVRLVDETHNFGQTMNAPYSVSIQVSPGTRPSQNQPANLLATKAIVDITAGNSITLPVPQDAGVISVDVTVSIDDGTTGEILGIHVDQGGSLITKTYNPTKYLGFQSLAPGSAFVNIVNGSAKNITVAVTWGIDG